MMLTHTAVTATTMQGYFNFMCLPVNVHQLANNRDKIDDGTLLLSATEVAER